MTDDTPDHHYATLLGLGTEWKVTKADPNVPGRRIDVVLEYAAESAVRPVCGKFGGVYDQQAERVWRHLDTMQFETPAHAKTPRVRSLPCADVVFGKYHVEARPNEGVDKTRKGENKVLLARDDKRLAGGKYLWPRGFEHMGDEAIAHRNDLLKRSLDTGRAWAPKELFGRFRKSRDRRWAKANFTFWHEQVQKSGLKHMIKVADTLKDRFHGLETWFDTRISNALTEGFNTTIQALRATARGYRNFGNFRTAIPFYCGKLDMRPDFVRVGASF